MIGGIVNAISNIGFGAANAVEQKKWNEQQQKNWQTQFDYTKWLNQKQMEREDTAVQRAKADYEAAGFNKLLAVGNPSETGTLTSYQGNAGGSAPQYDINPMEAYLQAKQSAANIAQTEAQTVLTRNQAETEKTKNEVQGALKGLYNIQTAKTKKESVKTMIETLRELNDYKIESEGGFKSNDSSRGTNIWSTMELLVRVIAQKFGVKIWDKFEGEAKKNPAFELDEKGKFKDFQKVAEELKKMYGVIY